MFPFVGDYTQKDAEFGYAFIDNSANAYLNATRELTEAVSRAYAYITRTKYTFILGFANLPAYRSYENTVCIIDDDFDGEGFQEITQVSGFMKSNFPNTKVRVYTNEDSRCTIVSFDADPAPVSSVILALISTLPMLTAWGDTPSVDTEAMTLLKECLACSKGGGTDSLRGILSDIHKKLGLESVTRARFINDLRKHMISGTIAAMERTLSDLKSEIEAKEAYLCGLYGEMTSVQYEIAGCKLSAENISLDDIMDYLDKNPDVNISGDDRGLTITSVGSLDFYDEDLAERMVQNRDSALYHSMMPETKDIWCTFFDAVFVEKRYKIVLASEIYVPFDTTGRVSITHIYNEDALENPHYERYSCLGANQTEIRKLANNGMYVPMMEMCHAATQSINLAESPVVDFFISKLRSTEKPCVISPDGRRLTPVQALKEINKGGNNGA